PPRRTPQRADGTAQELSAARIGTAETGNRRTTKIGVRPGAALAVATLLRPPCFAHAVSYLRRCFTCYAVSDVARRNGWHRDDQIDAIAQRPGKASAVLGDLSRRAAARATVVAEETARTRIHGADQHESRWKQGGSRRPRDRDASFLEWLTEHLQYAAIEFRQLVEEQHAVVRKRDFPWPGN